MPVKPGYPGVYVEETAGGARTITGVGTATTVFVGWMGRGPVDRAVRVSSFADFERHCGGIDPRSLLGYAVRHFFDNGGFDAYVVRLVAPNAASAAVTLDRRLRVKARSPGAWANEYAVEIRKQVPDPTRFGVALWHRSPGGPATLAEHFNDLSMLASDARAVDSVINGESALVTVARLGHSSASPVDTPANAPKPLAGGRDGDVLAPDTAEFERHFPPGATGDIFDRLDALDGFNLLVVPGETTPAVIASLQAYCRKRRAFCIVDSAEDATADSLRTGIGAGMTGPDAMNSALYFPWVKAADPLQPGRLRSFPPAGFVAGIYARVDSTRGVWKAPAGIETAVTGATGVAVSLNDAQNGELNAHGVNCIRQFPAGIVVWGSRTLHGDVQLGSEWRYVPVRRLALFIEESIRRGTQWAVFERNGEPLWAQLRRNVETFLNDLFHRGAFQGGAAPEAYFVRCDRSTTTPDDIDHGVVNVVVGFAPLKRAEFIVITLRQSAGPALT